MSLVAGILLFGLQSAGITDDACERPRSPACELVRAVRSAAEEDDDADRKAPPPTPPANRPNKAPTDGIQNGI